jgi:hypothetical protein
MGIDLLTKLKDAFKSIDDFNLTKLIELLILIEVGAYVFYLIIVIFHLK